MAIKSDLAFQLAKELANYIPEFQATQRRKERRNIVSALYKLRLGKVLNKREIEAYERYIDFVYAKWTAEFGNSMI